MTPLIIARYMPLDDLVGRVYHLELLECRDDKEFLDAIRLMQHNLDEVTDALGCDLSNDRRIRRAVDRVKTKAAHLKKLCTAVPQSFSDPQGWRFIAEQIMVKL
jgi:hypothetical protein